LSTRRFDQGSDDSYSCPTCRTSLSGKFKSTTTTARAAAESALIERHQQEALFQARAVNRYQEELARLRGRSVSQGSAGPRQVSAGLAAPEIRRTAENGQASSGNDTTGAASGLSAENGVSGVRLQQGWGQGADAALEDAGVFAGTPDLYRTAGGGQLLSDPSEGLNVGRLLAGLGLAGTQMRWQWPSAQNEETRRRVTEARSPAAPAYTESRGVEQGSQPQDAARDVSERAAEREQAVGEAGMSSDWDLGQAGPSSNHGSRSGVHIGVGREAALLREQRASARRARAGGEELGTGVGERLAEMMITIKSVLPGVPEQVILRVSMLAPSHIRIQKGGE
jgi:hypothetical protein